MTQFSVQVGVPVTTTLYAGEVLTVSSVSGSTGIVQRLGDLPGEPPQESFNVIAADVVKRGPYSGVRRYSISALGGALAVVTQPEDRLRDAINALSQSDLLLSNAGLAIGTGSAAKVKYNAFDFQVDGVAAHVAAGEVAFTPTTHDIADPDTDPREAIYVLSIAEGETAPTITKGATAAAGAAVAPATPANEIKLGEVLVQHDGSAIFDASTDDLDAAHLTVTFTSSTPTPVTID